MTSPGVTEQRVAIHFVFASKNTPMQTFDIHVLKATENMSEVGRTF